MKQESRTNINRVKKDISSPDSFTPPEELKRQLITTMQSIYDEEDIEAVERGCLLYTSPIPRDLIVSRMPSSA